MKRRILALILSMVVLMAAIPIPAFSTENFGEQSPAAEQQSSEWVQQPPASDQGQDGATSVTPPEGSNAGETEGSTAEPTAVPTAEPTAVPPENTDDGEQTQEPEVTSTPDPDAAETSAPEETEAPAGEETSPDENGAPKAPADAEAPEATPAPELLMVALSTGARSGFAGEAIDVQLDIIGGMGEITVAYSVLADGVLVNENKPKSVADKDIYTFVPSAYGNYMVRAAVTDATGQVAGATVTIQVAEHDRDSIAKWTSIAASSKLTADWRENIVTIAKSQLGYAENARDFIISENGSYKFFSIYGELYGRSYEEWCAAFVSFCAEYAGSPSKYFPRETAVEQILKNMKDSGAYGGSDCEPQAGDVIFFKRTNGALHTGVVRGADDHKVYTIEGSVNGAVADRKSVV